VRKTKAFRGPAAIFGCALVLGAIFAGAGSMSPAMAATLTLNPVRACEAVHNPGPGYSGSVGTDQNGETICISVGEKLLVFLSAPSTAPVWAPISLAPHGILVPAPLTLMLSRNVTAENFLANRPGVVKLTSHRPVCSVPQRSQLLCGTVQRWAVTVDVVYSRNIPLPPIRSTGRLPTLGTEAR
jgi:hypothetical protein